MTKRVSVSFKKGEEDLLEWIEDRVEDGTFRSKSHAMCRAVRMMKEEGVKEYNV